MNGSKPSADPRRSLYKHAGYMTFRTTLRLWATLMFRMRSYHHHNIPRTGGALICANHQSHLDPMLIGSAMRRRTNFVARKSLFKSPVFGSLISYLDAIPLDRDGMGLQGIKETIRRVRGGELVLIFPEGTRTRDGELGSMQPGICAIARRCKAPLVPVGFDGAYQAWPRSNRLPRPGRLAVSFGKPLMPQQYRTLSDEETIGELGSRIQHELEFARNQLRISGRPEF